MESALRFVVANFWRVSRFAFRQNNNSTDDEELEREVMRNLAKHATSNGTQLSRFDHDGRCWVAGSNRGHDFIVVDRIVKHHTVFLARPALSRIALLPFIHPFNLWSWHIFCETMAAVCYQPGVFVIIFYRFSGDDHHEQANGAEVNVVFKLLVRPTLIFVSSRDNRNEVRYGLMYSCYRVPYICSFEFMRLKNGLLDDCVATPEMYVTRITRSYVIEVDDPDKVGGFWMPQNSPPCMSVLHRHFGPFFVPKIQLIAIYAIETTPGLLKSCFDASAPDCQDACRRSNANTEDRLCYQTSTQVLHASVKYLRTASC